MLSDNQCQDACKTAACGWDSPDCDCAPGCSLFLLANTACDAQCSTADCGFDNGKCVSGIQGDCASGCFRSMIGNAVCDLSCDVEACSWDGLDCGCAAGCSEAEYGLCKDSCLVPECGYDAMPGFPSCGDTLVVAAARVYHLLIASFQRSYSYSEVCLSSTNTCTSSSWRLSLTSCIAECRANLQCLASFGNCATACPEHCEKCLDSNRCIGCLPGFVLFYTKCVADCPAAYAARNGLCVYSGVDLSSESDPSTVYVSSLAGNSNKGTLDSPFRTMSEALAAAYQKFNKIVMLRGVHTLSLSISSTRMHAWKDSGLFPDPSSVTISVEPLLCADFPAAAECCNSPPTLLFDNLNPVELIVAGVLRVKGVIFAGNTSLLDGCTAEVCAYCPSITSTSTGYVNDRGQVVTQFAVQDLCDKFQSHALISLRPAGRISVTNSTFANFRQGFASLIQFTSGTVDLTQVSFVNITTIVAVISQTSALDDNSYVSVLESSVELLNNGYEYRAAVQRGGFLSATGLRNVTVSKARFARNVMGTSGFLLHAENFLVMNIFECQFFLNVGAMVHIASNVQLPNKVDGGGNLLRKQYRNVWVSGCSFMNNTGKAIYIAMSGDALSTLISNTVFQYLLATDDNLIDIRILRDVPAVEKLGAVQGLYQGGTRYEVSVPPTNFTLANLTFSKCSAPSVLSSSNTPNLILRNVKVENSGDSVRTINTDTLTALSSYPGSYISLPASSPPSPVCVGLISLTAAYHAEFHTVTVASNVCSSGTAGLSVSASTGGLVLDSTSFVSNTGKHAYSATVLQLAVSETANLTRVKVVSNTHESLLGKGILSLISTADTSLFLISDSELRLNAIPDGGTLNCAGNVVVSNSVFDSNACKGSTAAGVLYTPSIFGSALVFDHTTFRNNTAVTGGAVMLYDNAATRIPVYLTITRSLFDLNRSQGSGSCILIDSSIRLSATSLIDFSQFTNNTAANGSLWVSFSSGVLTINNTLFRGSVGSNAGALYGQQPRSLVPGLPSLVILQNTVFEYGSGFAAIYFTNPEKNCEGRSSNLTLRFNYGRGIWLQYTYWEDTGSLFHNNTSPTSGAAFIVIFYSTVTLSKGTYIGNAAKLTGGAYSLSILSKVTVLNSTFVENSSERGGAIYAEQGLTMIMKSCVFLRNSAQKEGGAMYFFTGPLTSANSTMTDVLFEENQSKTGMGTVSLISSLLITERVTFRRNVAVSASGFLLYISTLTVINSTFESQHAEQGVYIMSPASSSINVTNCSFRSGKAVGKGGAIYISSSVLYLTASKFEDLEAGSGAAIAAFAESVVQISNSEFRRLMAVQAYGGAVLVSETSLLDRYSRYADVHNGVMVGLSAGIDLLGNTLESNLHADAYSKTGAALHCQDCRNLKLRSTSFRNLTAEKGACLHLLSTLDTHELALSDSLFKGSQAADAGAVLLENIDADISGCIFYGNSAKENPSSGDGGALYLSCTLPSRQCVTNITNSVFDSNSARRNGGAVYWTDRKPTLENVTFQNNTAEYGNNLASFAVSLALNHSLEPNSTYELKDLASGQKSLNSLDVVLVDHYGQVVRTDDTSQADLLPGNSMLSSVTGATRVQASSGQFHFSDFTVTSKPGADTQLFISSSGIDPSTVILTDLEITYQPSLKIVANMRNCTVGESLVGDACYICPEGKFSLDPGLPCANCPDGAVCYGNSTMAPKEGYWRSSNTTDVFWECPNPNSCLGSADTLNSSTGTCQTGYYGNLCQGCLTGFSRSQSNICAKCPDKAINSVQLAGIAIAIAIVCVFIIKMSLISAQKQQSQSSIFLKIFVNYVQLAAAMSSFNMNWPRYALNTFKMQENVANVSMQLFSIDCFLDNGSTAAQADSFYTKTIVIAVIPLCIIAVSLLFWSVFAVAAGRKGFLKYQMVNSIVVLFFIAHPSIITFMFDVFNCRQINPGEYWLTSYLNIRCWDRLHSRTAMLIALPSLLLWGVCTPLVALVSLILLKKRLLELHVRIRLGFLYTGYDSAKYFWEFVIMYRKMIVITMSVFLTNVSTSIQVLSVLLVLVFAYVLQIRNSPYNSPVFNQLERRSILVSSVTIYCGLFYMSHDLDSYSEVLLFTLMMLVNAYFLLYWLMRIGQVGFRFFAKRCQCLRRFITSFPYLSSVSNPQRASVFDESDLSFSMDRSSGQARVRPISDKSMEVPNNSASDIDPISRPQISPTLGVTGHRDPHIAK